MLQVEGLSFSYGKIQVLKSVSFSLNRGVGCLLGPNGAGKSTLLKCLAGVLTPLRGEVKLDGINLLALDYRERAKLVSYAPQEFNMAFPYRVFDVVLMGRNPHVNPLTGPDEEDEELAWRALEELGIAHLAGKPFTELSGGQKRLVIIARAVAQGGNLLILDEPTSFLDFKNQHLVLSSIRELSRRLGVLALVSLHDPNQAMVFCDEVFLIRNGRIISHGPVSIISGELIASLYDMEVIELKVDGRKFIVPGDKIYRGAVKGTGAGGVRDDARVNQAQSA